MSFPTSLIWTKRITSNKQQIEFYSVPIPIHLPIIFLAVSCFFWPHFLCSEHGVSLECSQKTLPPPCTLFPCCCLPGCSLLRVGVDLLVDCHAQMRSSLAQWFLSYVRSSDISYSSLNVTWQLKTHSTLQTEHHGCINYQCDKFLHIMACQPWFAYDMEESFFLS